MISRVRASQTEITQQKFDGSTLEYSSEQIRTQGVLILEKILHSDLLDAARQSFLERYNSYLQTQIPNDTLEVGPSRRMITIDFEPPFDRREIYANPWLLSVLQSVFASDFVLGGFGVVCSLPGAAKQHIHRDNPTLFKGTALDRIIPVFAVTVAIPLLEMNDVNGTTAFWPGSHREELRPTDDKVGEEPHIQLGSCALWDFRLFHGGTANHGAATRPLLYMTFCRPWYTDYVNFEKQKPFIASKKFVSRIPPDLHFLMQRVINL